LLPSGGEHVLGLGDQLIARMLVMIVARHAPDIGALRGRSNQPALNAGLYICGNIVFSAAIFGRSHCTM
jgi:hypothetical protein